MESVPTIDRVLFCVADQWRADALGILGTPGVKTPNLDALAADGTALINHWCEASPCGPSRTSLLTGTPLTTHGQWTNEHPADHGLPTLAGTLRSAGVAADLVGYTDTPQPGADLQDPARWRELVDPDFDVLRPFIWQHGFSHWQRALDAAGVDLGDDHPFGLYAPDGEPDADGLAPARYPAEHSDVAFLTDAAVDAIDGWAADRRLLHVNWLRPHPPMTAPRPYHRLVHPDEVDLPDKPLTVDEQAAIHPYFDATVPGRSMTEYLQRRCRLDAVGEREDRLVRAAYYGLVAEVDHHLGRLVAELEERGQYESTLIIVTSDHGDALGDHWIYGRRGPFDGHFKVPCIVRDPRPSADPARGSTVDTPTIGADLFPTICDAMGVDVPPTVAGRSLTPLLAGDPPADWRTSVRYSMSFADHAKGRSAAADELRFTGVRTSEYRLVRFDSMPPLLFDLVEDPAETTNVAGDPRYRSVLDTLLT
jgi:arylsulfatase A-like enzyme